MYPEIDMPRPNRYVNVRPDYVCTFCEEVHESRLYVWRDCLSVALCQSCSDVIDDLAMRLILMDDSKQDLLNRLYKFWPNNAEEFVEYWREEFIVLFRNEIRMIQQLEDSPKYRAAYLKELKIFLRDFMNGEGHWEVKGNAS